MWIFWVFWSIILILACILRIGYTQNKNDICNCEGCKAVTNKSYYVHGY